MTNINVRVVGTANLAQMTSAFGQLQAQVASLNAQLAQMVNTSKTVDPTGFERLSKAAELNSKVYRNAAASTGMFEVQQVRLNSATDEYVKKLKAQKTSFRELIRTRKIAAAAYKEQLAMEQSMQVRRNPASNIHGREVFDVTYPRMYTKEMDNAANRLSWFNEQLKSGSTQMVNWGKNTQWAGRQLMVGFTMPLAAFGAAAGVMAYQVDKELTRVQKVYDTTANANSTNMNDMIAVEKELEQVRKQGMETAIMAAKQYGSTGTDTLAVQAELAATGKQGVELQKATSEVMRISRLGEVDYQTTTEATIALQQIFKMSTEELTEAFDYMNSVENATSLATADFAAAIPIAAAPVKAFGGDIKELGLLLTAMKEEGIGASEGATALKATMQRLGRPSKQIREEWTALTGTDITKIVDDSEGLVEVFQGINTATRDLDPDAQRKAFAGLFGSYQVTKMMALTKGMEDLNDETSQVNAAFRIGQQDSSEWAATAEREIQRYRESVSGQFDTALQEVKLQLATLGEPFVEAATSVLKVVSMLIDGFNSLPDFGKKIIAWTALLAGIAGPVVMLTGLLGNLFGNGLKAIAGVLSATSRLGAGMQILDKENRIAAASAKMMEAGYVSQTKAVQSLTAALAPLAAAQRAANSASVGMTNPAAVPRYSKAAKAKMNEEASAAYFQRVKDTMQVTGVKGNTYYANEQGMRMSNANVNAATMTMLHDEALAMNKEMDKADKASAKVATNTKKIGNFLAYGAAGTTAMAAGMALTMATSNETANNIGEFLIIGSMVVPAIGMMVSGLSKVNLLAAKTAITTKATAAATAVQAKWTAANAALELKAAGSAGKHAAGVHKAATATSKMGAAAKIAGTAFLGMMGPIGWAATAIGAIAAGLYIMHKREQEAWKERVDAAKVLDNSAKSWAEAVGNVADEYERISLAGAGNEKSEDRFERYRSMLADKDSPIGKAAEEFGKLDSAAQVDQAKTMFVELQQVAGMTGEQARDAMAAIFTTTGQSFTAAKDDAAELYRVVGELESLNWGAHMARQADQVHAAMAEFIDNPDNDELFKDAANDLADVFGAAFANADAGMDARIILEDFTNTALSGFNDAFESLNATPLGENFLTDNDITNAQELAAWYNETANAGTLISAAMGDWDGRWMSTLNSAQDVETTLVKAVATSQGLGSEIDTVAELLKEANINARTLNYDDAVLAAKELARASAARDSSEAGSSKSVALTAINAMNVAHGFKEGKTEAQALRYLINEVKVGAGGAANEADKIETNLAGAKSQASLLASALRGMKAPDLANMFQGAYANVQQEIADEYVAAFDEQQDAEMQRTQDRWDSRVEAVNSDIERQQDALDNKWERKNAASDKYWENRKDAAENYWDSRVESVERAIEAEQKAEEKRQEMFEAEIARIQKLNEAANRDIDFNIALNEGNLDEAAKIRNDANAAADQYALSAVQDQLSKRSEKRVGKLEDKKESIEDQREAAMKALEQQEEDAKAAMQRREEAEKAHLEKVGEMRQKAAEAQRDAAVAAKEKELADQKKMLDESIKVFMSGTAAEKKEMRRRMEEAGLSYEWFQEKVIHPKGLEWGQYFGNKLQSELRISAQKIASDAMWAQMGAGSVEEMAKAMGFSSKKSMFHFLETGEIKDFAEAPRSGGNGKAGSSTGRSDDVDSVPIRHEGGPISGGRDSRKGVAKNHKGLHPSEKLVLAQKGEFIVNKHAAAQNQAELEAINSGRKPLGDTVLGGEPGIGPAPMLAAAIMRGLTKRVNEKLAQAVANKQAVMAGASGYSSGAGNYALGGVKPWVAEAAGYLGGKFGIASIGGVGDRAANPFSDHPKGLALDFMTNDVEKGWALAQEALRLQSVLDATYMIWQGKIHSFDSRGWQDYSHPSGATDPTSMHMDHVHISFAAAGKAGDLPGSIANSATLNTAVPDALVMGAGGAKHPTGGVGSRGTTLHGSPPAYDISLPEGNNIYAVRDGVISASYDIPGYEPRARHGGLGYRSYGRVITMNHDGGGSSLYAHLSARYAQAKQRVKAGTVIGKSGNTGYSTGPHLHFGATPGPSLYLKKGAANINFDNTPAMLHKNEAVLTEDLNRKFHEGVDNFAKGPSSTYTVIVHPSEGMDEEMLANKVVKKLKAEEARKPQSRTARR